MPWQVRDQLVRQRMAPTARNGESESGILARLGDNYPTGASLDCACLLVPRTVHVAAPAQFISCNLRLYI